MYLIYDEIENAEIDLQKIYATMVQETACYHGGTMLNIETEVVEFVLTLDDTELTKEKYPLFGFVENTLNKKYGYTTAWDTILKLNDGRFAIHKSEYNISMLNIEEIEDISGLIPQGGE